MLLFSMDSAHSPCSCSLSYTLLIKSNGNLKVHQAGLQNIKSKLVCKVCHSSIDVTNNVLVYTVNCCGILCKCCHPL